MWYILVGIVVGYRLELVDSRMGDSGKLWWLL